MHVISEDKHWREIPCTLFSRRQALVIIVIKIFNETIDKPQSV